MEIIDSCIGEQQALSNRSAAAPLRRVRGSAVRFGWKKSIAFLTLIVLFCGAAPRVSAQNWTAEDKDIWKKAIKRVVTTPPCCGACSLVDMEQGRKAYRYITGEDRSAEAEKIYNDHAKKFLDAFRYFSASRYDYWFGPSKEGSNEK